MIEIPPRYVRISLKLILIITTPNNPVFFKRYFRYAPYITHRDVLSPPKFTESSQYHTSWQAPQNACTQCVAMIHMRNAWCATGRGGLRKTLSAYGAIAASRECSLTIVVLNKILYDMIL